MEKKFLEMATFLPQYQGLSADDLNFVPGIFDDNDIPAKDDNDDLLRLIFAPDPLTGLPHSELGLMMSKDTSPVVAQFIRDTLMSPQPSTASCGDDADFALQSVRNYRESFEDYANRLRELCCQ